MCGFIGISIYIFLELVLIRGSEIKGIGSSYVGVVFSPPEKRLERNESEGNYNLLQVESMLENIVDARFNSIATFGMGVEWYNMNNTRNSVNPNGLVAMAAANLNLKKGNLTLRVLQGINVKPTPSALEREIENAFQAAAQANKIFPGTVWALVLDIKNQTVDPASWSELRKALAASRKRARDLGLKIGPKIQNCEVITDTGPNQKIFQEIVKASDFILCVLYPASQTGGERASETVFTAFKNQRRRLQRLFPQLELEIILETGTQSSPDQETNDIDNTEIYLRRIAELSNEYRIHSYTNPKGLLDINAGKNPNWLGNKRSDNPSNNKEKIAEPHVPLDLQNSTSAKDSSTPTKDRGPDINPGAVFGLVFGNLLLVLVPIIIYCIYRCRQSKENSGLLTETEIQEFEKGIRREPMADEQEELALLLPYDRTYEIPKNKLMIDTNQILGKGEYGIVYLGRIQGMEESVAFKTVKSSETADKLKNLLSELKIMIYLGKHENVVNLLGAYTSEIRNGIVFIAAEFCSLGSLQKYLRNFAKSLQTEENVPIVRGKSYVNMKCGIDDIPISQLIKWSSEIACGMEWLANKKVIHADLASRNVLLTANKTAKITDFGLSRRLYEYANYVKKSHEPLPWRWMAIESMRSMDFSTQSDVWAYAVTVWEIFSMGDVPYPGLSWNVYFVHELEKGLRLSPPKYASEDIYTKLLECWKQEPCHRPNFTDLSQFFKELQNVN